MKVLAIDTSGASLSVAILENEKVISDFYINTGLTHSETLAPIIDLAIKNSLIKVSDIDLYASTVGPGSFTGLRIGLATVKAMALVNEKDCVAISTLEALAYEYKDFEGYICCCIDARHGEVYNAIFKSESGNLKRITEDRSIYIENLKNELKKLKCKIKLVGDCCKVCYNEFLGENLDISLGYSTYINAKSVGYIALEKYSNKETISPEKLNPKYLKLSQAERLLKEKQSKEVLN